MSEPLGNDAAPNPQTRRARTAQEAAVLMRRSIERCRVYLVQPTKPARCARCGKLSELRFGHCYACVSPYLEALCTCGHAYHGHREGPTLLTTERMCAAGRTIKTSECNCRGFVATSAEGESVVASLLTVDN